MEVERLYQILQATTVQLRKGEEVEGDPELVEVIKRGDDVDQMPGGTVHIYAMPHESEAGDGIKKVDCHFITVGVNKAKAEELRGALVDVLKGYPQPDRLAGGSSYIEVGGVIGDQGAAFQLFALGKVLGLWDIITPATLGITGSQADQLAGGGLVMMSGYKPEEASVAAQP
ncbi:hypothetical protein KJ713_00980 [Patescibacteria group bacterium]|nr:hypothetical protein [Patescibacteria group bacterium]